MGRLSDVTTRLCGLGGRRIGKQLPRDQPPHSQLSTSQAEGNCPVLYPNTPGSECGLGIVCLKAMKLQQFPTSSVL